MEEASADQHLRSGQLLVITQGAYSLYGLKGVVRIRRACTLKDIRQGFLQTIPEEMREDPFYHLNEEYETFVCWLVAEGYAERVESLELSIGTYAEFEPRVKPLGPLRSSLS